MATPVADHEVLTAGVILRYREHFVFQTGLNRDRSALGVVRLGGHREAGETLEQCATREVREEAGVSASIASSRATHWYDADVGPVELESVDWGGGSPRPLLLSTVQHEVGVQGSVTFLASTNDEPAPGAESQALLFLTEADVHRIAMTSISFGEFLRDGGIAHQIAALDHELLLRPHGQLLALHQLLASA